MDTLKPYKGGEELRRAAAALAGPSLARATQVMLLRRCSYRAGRQHCLSEK